MRHFTTNRTLQAIMAFVLILSISTESLAITKGYINLVNRHTFVGIVLEVKRQTKTTTQNTEGHPGTGAAVGGATGWYLLGGPIAIIGGAVVGSKIGSKKAKTVSTTTESLVIVARNIQNKEIHYLTITNDSKVEGTTIYAFAKDNMTFDILSSLRKGQKIKIPSDHALQIVDKVGINFIYIGNERIPHLR